MSGQTKRASEQLRQARSLPWRASRNQSSFSTKPLGEKRPGGNGRRERREGVTPAAASSVECTHSRSAAFVARSRFVAPHIISGCRASPKTLLPVDQSEQKAHSTALLVTSTTASSWQRNKRRPAPPSFSAAKTTACKIKHCKPTRNGLRKRQEHRRRLVLNQLTSIILSPTRNVPSASDAPPGMIFVTKMPLSPGAHWFPTPPAMVKPRPASEQQKNNQLIC